MNLFKLTSKSSPQLDKLVAQWARIITILSLLLALIPTLFPYDFFFQEVITGFEFHDLFAETSVTIEFSDLILNILLFLPFGFGCTCLLYSFRLRETSAFIIVIAASFSLTVTIESLQIFLPVRASSLIDVLTNTTGGIFGFLCFRLWAINILRATTAFVERSKKFFGIKQLAIVFVCYVFSTSLISIPLQNAANLWSLSNWEHNFPITLGNEPTGNRPWRGSISEFAVANKAFSEEEVARTFFQEPFWAVANNSLIAHYQLMVGESYRDRSGQLPSLIWRGKPGETEDERGISLTSAAWLQTASSATLLTQKILETSKFTLSIALATADENQTGPARIFSVSKNTAERNITLGQNEDSLSVRLRTPITGVNGTNPELIVPKVFNNTNPHKIIISYDGSDIRLYIDSSQRSYTFKLTPEAALFWSLSPSSGGSIHISGFNNEFYQFLFYGIVFIPLGAILALISKLLKGKWLFHSLFYIGGLLPAFILEAILASTNKRNIEPINLLLGMTITVIAMLVVKFSVDARLSSRRIN